MLTELQCEFSIRLLQFRSFYIIYYICGYYIIHYIVFYIMYAVIIRRKEMKMSKYLLMFWRRMSELQFRNATSDLLVRHFGVYSENIAADVLQSVDSNENYILISKRGKLCRTRQKFPSNLTGVFKAQPLAIG